MESSEVFQTSIQLVAMAASLKQNKNLPKGSFRGFAHLESAHPNDNFALTQLNPSPPSGGFLSVAAATIFPPYGGVPVGTAHSVCYFRRFAASSGNKPPFWLPAATLFAAPSPPTWSPCSRPFAILPVSAVSDAQKLATGNFLHVRAVSFRRHAERAPFIGSPSWLQAAECRHRSCPD